MHLTEAYLAARAAGDAAWYEDALRRIADGVSLHFLDTATQCIAELPAREAGNRIEPGHQFEWYALVRGALGVFQDTGLAASVVRAADYAQQHGVTPGTEGVCASLDSGGAVLDATQRDLGADRIRTVPGHARRRNLAARPGAAAGPFPRPLPACGRVV